VHQYTLETVQSNSASAIIEQAPGTDIFHAQEIQENRIVSFPPERGEKKPESVDLNTSLVLTGGWQDIKNETFEGIWPSTGWTVVDLSNDGFDRKWDDDTYRYHAGYYAAWPARGGTNGLDPSSSNNDYFNNMNTRMTYGPFDLVDAVKAEVSFWLWREIENNYDYLTLEVSRDGVNGPFQEIGRWTGSAGWQQQSLSLDGYTGDSSVWIAWRFYSNNSIVFDGPWVDDILIRKYVPGQVTAQGTFYYTDRNNSLARARYTKVYLYDQDPGISDDLLATTTTDSNGFFSNRK